MQSSILMIICSAGILILNYIRINDSNLNNGCYDKKIPKPTNKLRQEIKAALDFIIIISGFIF